MNNGNLDNELLGENVIIVDADYIDHVAFNLIVNFERMIGRRIPRADLAKWLVCVALDGGLGIGNTSDSTRMPSNIQVILIHDKKKDSLQNFLPAHYGQDIQGKAFQDSMGEFQMTTVAVEDIVNAEDLFLDIVGTVLAYPKVKRMMIVPNAEQGTLYDDLRETLRRSPSADSKHITVFTMEPLQGGNFRQEILGYSLMAALGIRSEEIT